jgi:hypothetical protein
MADLEDRDKCEPFLRTVWEHHRTDAQRTSGNSAAACYGAGQTDVCFDVILRPHVSVYPVQV